MKKFKTALSSLAIATASLMSLVSFSANAQVLDGVPKNVSDKLLLNVSKATNIAPSQINYVGKTAFPGMYLVMMNNFQVTFLTDVNAKNVMVGDYIETKTNRNIGNEIKEKHQKVDLSVFKKENMIVDKKGSGKNVVYIVADANCTFCQKLEAESIPVLKGFN